MRVQHSFHQLTVGIAQFVCRKADVSQKLYFNENFEMMNLLEIMCSTIFQLIFQFSYLDSIRVKAQLC